KNTEKHSKNDLYSSSSCVLCFSVAFLFCVFLRPARRSERRERLWVRAPLVRIRPVVGRGGQPLQHDDGLIVFRHQPSAKRTNGLNQLHAERLRRGRVERARE